MDSWEYLVASKKKSVPKGYHMMPGGKLMKGSKHGESAKHERTESKAEKRIEYGLKAKPKIKTRSSK